MKHFIIILLMLLTTPVMALAQPATATDAPVATEPKLPSEADEARAQALFKQLRCVVCEGQSLADSNALLAEDMRGMVRKKIALGLSDAEVLHFFSRQYGDEILMKPPFNLKTGMLWLAPLLLLVFGASRIHAYFHRNS